MKKEMFLEHENLFAPKGMQKKIVAKHEKIYGKEKLSKERTKVRQLTRHAYDSDFEAYYE